MEKWTEGLKAPSECFMALVHKKSCLEQEAQEIPRLHDMAGSSVNDPSKANHCESQLAENESTAKIQGIWGELHD